MITRPPQRNVGPSADPWAKWIEAQVLSLNKTLSLQKSSISSLASVSNNALSLGNSNRASADEMFNVLGSTVSSADGAVTWSPDEPTNDRVFVPGDGSEENPDGYYTEASVPPNNNAIWYQIDAVTGTVLTVWQWEPSALEDEPGQWVKQEWGTNTLADGAVDWDKLNADIDDAIHRSIDTAATADGKITVALADPTAGDGDNKPTGALWEVRVNNVAVRRFIWDGTAWEPYTLGSAFIGDNAIDWDNLNADIDGAIQTATDVSVSADGKITISDRNPVSADAEDKPTNAIWEVRSGAIVLRRFMLSAADVWEQVAIGQDFIGENAIGSAQIIDASVGNAQIANLAVSEAKIANLAVTNAKIAELAVKNANIDDLAVTGAKIANATIGEAHIIDASIGTAKIGAAQITEALIDDLAVSEAKIKNAAISSAKIAELAVQEAHIEDLAITEAKIANAAITNAKIANLDAGKITAGTIEAARIAGVTLTGNLLQTTEDIDRGVKIDSVNGLRVFSNTGTLDVQLNPNIHYGIAVRAPNGLVPLTEVLLNKAILDYNTFYSITAPANGSTSWFGLGTSSITNFPTTKALITFSGDITLTSNRGYIELSFLLEDSNGVAVSPDYRVTLTDYSGVGIRQFVNRTVVATIPPGAYQVHSWVRAVGGPGSLGALSGMIQNVCVIAQPG